MYLSPPLTVMAGMAALVAVTVWIAPPQEGHGAITITVPAATHQKLARWGAMHAGADGTPSTVVRAVEVLANDWERGQTAPPLNGE